MAAGEDLGRDADLGADCRVVSWVGVVVSTAFDTAFACAIATRLFVEWPEQVPQEPVNFAITSFTKNSKCDGVVSRFSTPSLEPPFSFGFGYVASRRLRDM